MFDLKAYLNLKNRQINDALHQIFSHAGADSSRIRDAMQYSLMAGGKRIRPVLCIAAAEAVGSESTSKSVEYAACAIEMIHTYSLIHDDLPAMDDDALRRGKPTCHIAYDEATAILAGDALLTYAFEVLAAVPCATASQAFQLLNVIQIISRAAGYQGMIEGQMRDIFSEGKQLDLASLEKMHALKTGAIIEAAVWTGAILGGGNSEQIERLKTYAKNIGLAFQVTDDILNVEGDPELLGKAVGTDKDRKKSTYPAIMGLEESKHKAKEMIENALQSLDLFDKKAEPLRAVARYIIERKH